MGGLKETAPGAQNIIVGCPILLTIMDLGTSLELFLRIYKSKGRRSGDARFHDVVSSLGLR